MSPVWLLFGSITVWLTLLMPPLTLLSWWFEFRPWPWLGVAILLAPLVMLALMRALQTGPSATRWWWVQALGAGALLMLLILPGVALGLWLPDFQIAMVITLAWALLVLYAITRAIRIHDQHLSIRTPLIDARVRLVQISDVHVGSRSPGFLARVVKQVQQHKPDIVVITGDLLDAGHVGERELSALAALECPTLMCIGNHERYVALDAAVSAIRQQGVRVLRDSSLRIGALRFIGLDDRDRPSALPDLLAQLLGTQSGSGKTLPDSAPDTTASAVQQGDAAHAGEFRILLYHRPDGWAAARAAGIQLTLSGHTHGGQIWPFGLLVKRQYPDTTGHFTDERGTLYVSPGTGTWGPTLRLGTRSEMTIIDLEPMP